MLQYFKAKTPFAIRFLMKDFLQRKRGISFLKTIFWSLQFKNPVSISNQTTIKVRKNCLCFNGDSALRVGVRYGLRFHGTNDRTNFICENNGKIILNGIVSIHKGCNVVVKNGATLSIGDGTYLNEGCQILCKESVTIGQGCAIAWGVNILDSDQHVLVENLKFEKPSKKKICIGDHVWIGCNSIILKGVNIGDGAVIGAGSVVTRDVPSHTMVAGVPARLIHHDIDWK